MIDVAMVPTADMLLFTGNHEIWQILGCSVTSNCDVNLSFAHLHVLFVAFPFLE